MAVDEKTVLLTLEERAICQWVSATGETPHNQRANALLALDEGLSQTEAGERAGLTAGQVKYWLSKFRQQGMDIFPEDLQAQLLAVEPPENTEEATEKAHPTETDGKKIKKSKKAKDKKKKSKKVKEKHSKKKKKDLKKKITKKAKNKKKKDQKRKKPKKAKKGKK